MPTPTYIPLGTITLASTDSEIVFSSIPATYRDLIITGQVRSTRASATEDLFIRLNDDTGTNYSSVFMYGTSSGANTFSATTSGAALFVNTIAASGTSNVYSSVNGTVMDYSATDKHKTMLGRNGGGNQDQVWAGAHRWANTSAVTSLTFYYKLASLAAGTTISIYGVN